MGEDVDNVNYLGAAVSIAIFASLLLPWWSIRAPGVSIDIYPFGVAAWSVATHDDRSIEWVVDHLLALDGALLMVALLVAVSGVLSLVGSLRFPALLVTPVFLNVGAAFLFYSILRSAIGKLALGYGSGTNLQPIPGEPWGFAVGIGVCVLAGLAAPASLILSCLKRPTA